MLWFLPTLREILGSSPSRTITSNWYGLSGNTEQNNWKFWFNDGITSYPFYNPNLWLVLSKMEKNYQEYFLDFLRFFFQILRFSGFYLDFNGFFLFVSLLKGFLIFWILFFRFSQIFGDFFGVCETFFEWTIPRLIVSINHWYGSTIYTN